MEKKDQGKKMDPNTFWSQVMKSGQMKATSSSTSGSSFTGAAAGGAWTSSGTVGGEHGHLLGLRVEEHGHLLSNPCRLLGHHGPRTSPCHKNRGRS